jgi:hypothetical protein
MTGRSPRGPSLSSNTWSWASPSTAPCRYTSLPSHPSTSTVGGDRR